MTDEAAQGASDSQIIAISEAIRVAYLRGTKDPEKKHLTSTIHELRDFLVKAIF